MDVRRVYEYALQREREGLDFFRSKAETMHHAAARGVFLQLAAEEERHIQFVEGLIADLDGGGLGAEEVLKRGGFFDERAERELLDQSVVEAMVPDVAVLRVAWLIERDLAQFYAAQAAVAEGAAKRALEHLARWEQGHEALFRDMHDRVLATYGAMPWGG